jgi:hypothetical protein
MTVFLLFPSLIMSILGDVDFGPINSVSFSPSGNSEKHGAWIVSRAFLRFEAEVLYGHSSFGCRDGSKLVKITHHSSIKR